MEIYLLFEVRDNVYYNESSNTYGYDNDVLMGVYDSYEKALKAKEELNYFSLRIEKAKLNTLI